MNKGKKLLTYFVIAMVALINALSFELFIFPNNFAPAGLNGLCTMFQHVTGLSMGYLSFLLNLPLAVAVYKTISKTLAVRAMTYVALFSALLVILDQVDLSAFQYLTTSSAIIGPVVGGIIGGAGTALLLKAGAYTGGLDFISSLIHKRRPDINFYYASFAMNCVVAGISYFVYGHKIEPVLMCILCSFASSTVMDKIDRAGRSAIRFEITTPEPEKLAEAILHQLHRGATVIPGKGLYRGEETNVLICVVNKTQAYRLAAIIQSVPGTFAVVNTVNEVMGNFRHMDNQGNLTREYLDPGEGTGI